MTIENLLFSTSTKFEIISLDKIYSVLIIKIKSIQPVYYGDMGRAFQSIQARKFCCCHLECILKVFTEGFEKHSGRYCYGKTPLQTFLDCKTIAKSKNINELFGKRDNFKLPEKAESASAGEHPARNTQADGNEKGAENFSGPFSNSFFEQFLKKLTVRSSVGYYNYT